MKRLMFVLLAVLVVLAAGCGQTPAENGNGENGGESGEASGEPIVIGAIFTYTGDAAPIGMPEKKTAEMLVEKINSDGGINGREIKLELFDDQGKPPQAVQACQKLLDNEEVVAIIGPSLSGTTLAIADMCEKAKMPLVSCGASVKIVDPVKSYVFKTAQSDSHAAQKILDYCKDKGITKVGFINDSNAFGASGREQWVKYAKEAGVETVAMESFETSDTDMTSQLTNIRGNNPDAVVCWGTHPGPAMVAKDMKRLGMEETCIMSHGISNKKFIELAGSGANGVVFPSGKLIVASEISDDDPQKSVLLEYTKLYEEKYGELPDHFGGHAWDAVYIVKNAIEKAGTDREKVRDAIEGADEFVGVSGVFTFSEDDHSGLTKDAFAMVVIEDGEWKLAE